MRRAIAAAVIAVALLGGSAASAAGAVVTLVRPIRADALALEATARLEAELRAAGFEVRTIEAISGDARADVEQVEGSFATIAIVPAGRSAAIDVWIADRVTRKTVVRRVEAGPATAASDLAVRAVELLHASLIEIRQRPRSQPELRAEVARLAETTPPVALPATLPPSPTPRPSPPSVPPPSAPPSPPSPSLGTLTFGAALLASPEGGVAPCPLLRVAVDLPLRFSLRLSAVPTSTPMKLTAAQGTVDARQTLGFVDVAFAIRPPESTFVPLLAIGAGAYEVRVDGHPREGWSSRHDHGVSALLATSAGLTARLTAALRALAEVQAMVLLPGQAVTAAGVPLAHLGRPLLLPSLGLIGSF